MQTRKAKWLINKGMLAYRVSAGTHPPLDLQAHPPQSRGAEDTDTGEGSITLLRVNGHKGHYRGYTVSSLPLIGVLGGAGVTNNVVDRLRAAAGALSLFRLYVASGGAGGYQHA